MHSISCKLTIGCCTYQGKGSCNGKRGERWYHSFDSVKHKHYEGSLLKINFWSKVYSKGHLCCVPHLRKSYLLHSMDTDI